MDALADMINLLIDFHPQGFGVLLGAVKPPNAEEIHTMMDARRSYEDAGVHPASVNTTVKAERIVWDEETFQEVIRRAWGWPHIYRISQEHRKYDSRMWRMVMDYSKYVTNTTLRSESRLDKLANIYGTTPQTILKYRREFPKELASVILMPPADWSGPGFPVD